MSRVIVVAVDGSQIGEHAFCWYLSNLYRDGDEVNIIHVHDMSEIEVPYILGPEPIIIPDSYEESIKESFKKTLILDHCVPSKLPSIFASSYLFQHSWFKSIKTNFKMKIYHFLQRTVVFQEIAYFLNVFIKWYHIQLSHATKVQSCIILLSNWIQAKTVAFIWK